MGARSLAVCVTRTLRRSLSGLRSAPSIPSSTLRGALVIDLPTFTRVRALLMITAGAPGLGMLAGNFQHGPLTLGTVLQVLVGWSFVGCGIFIWARRRPNRLGPLMTT